MADKQSGDTANNKLWSRFVRLEATVDGLSKAVESFVSAADKRDREMYDRFDRLQREFGTSRQTNWPLMIGVSSLFLAFAGMMAGLVAFSVQATVSPLTVHVSQSRERMDRWQDKIDDIPNVEARLDILEKITIDPLVRGLSPRRQIVQQRPLQANP